MASKGPVTSDTSSLALGLMQVRVGTSAANIDEIQPQFTSSNSIGSLTASKFVGNVDWFEHSSGFPKKPDYSIALSESASIEGTFEEISPANLALAYGLDPTSYSLVHSGEIALGDRTSPTYIRCEGYYEFPNGSNYMTIIFPRAQAKSTVEVDLQAEAPAGVPFVIDSKIADSNVSGGHALWDDKPLGRIVFT